MTGAHELRLCIMFPSASTRQSDHKKSSMAVEFAHNHKQQAKAGWQQIKKVVMSRLFVQLKLSSARCS